MTLPASFPLSMSQIATELGLSFPLSLNHAWVIALAQKSGLPVSISDLLGKTGRFDGNLLGHTSGGLYVQFGSAPFFGGTLFEMDVVLGGSPQVILTFGGAPNWSGNIKVTNNTTAVSVTLPQLDPTHWVSNVSAPNLIRNGITDSFTILPSS